MIPLIITLYILAALITTVVLMVVDRDEPDSDSIGCLAGGLIWPIVLVFGLFFLLANGLQRIADWIIERIESKS